MSSKPVRGMKDQLPKNTVLRDYVTSVLLTTYSTFGFERIETPCLEKLTVLSSSDSGENKKLIYKTIKRGAKLNLTKKELVEEDITDLGLRYDLTVPLSRFYANNRAKLQQPFKSVQMGPVWRAERPQNGRFRQFTQCDIDIIGDPTELAELDFLFATTEALKKLQLEKYLVKINDRRILTHLFEHSGFDSTEQINGLILLDKLDKIGFEGLKAAFLSSNYESIKVEKLLTNIKELVTSSNPLKTLKKFSIPGDVLSSLTFVLEIATKNNIKMRFDPTLVRGQGYYTGQIFEITYAGYPFSIAGGGRYNKMLSKYSDSDTPACGFSIGFERILTILEDKNYELHTITNKVAFLVEEEVFKTDTDSIMSHLNKLRRQHEIVSCLFKRKKLHNQLNELKNHGFTHFVVYQPDTMLEVKGISLL